MSVTPVTDRSIARQGIALAAFLALCLSVGLIGGWVTAPALPGWYAGLAKPTFNPPNWIFGPVWTALYILMAIAAWLVWRRGEARTALRLFALQLVLNALWSPLFFGLHRIDLALIDIVLMWAAIAATALAFRHPSLLAAVLMLPYLGWVSFASGLNLALWRLN